MLKRLGLILLALSVVAFLSPANALWVKCYGIIQNQIFDLLIDSGRIIGITLVLAGLLAPFEALGWWAGWYDGQSDRRTLSYRPTLSPLEKITTTAPHYNCLS
ncbi:hypothetical protein I4641_09120 [Waterburya agarophytonicola K14]|uniref:Uncharacterized protein n=1 Tax=Waterburya agarophytonicola KI4 TaxID=2874699 RepID=A0A964BRZ3_9CYAN|nr:hypothetical protein [Waterburya agarophytonicola]MCC0177136.1 hypothetical protein [Waterburya agarophytonicola KI4]